MPARYTTIPGLTEQDAAKLLEAILGELRVVDHQLKALGGKVEDRELSLARRLVAMAAGHIAQIC